MMLEGCSRKDDNASPLDNFTEFTAVYIRKGKNKLKCSHYELHTCRGGQRELR